MKRSIVLILGLTLVVADDPYRQLFSSGNRQFTATLYDEVKLDNNDNFLISAFSLETVLALTQSGAVGTTGQEIRKTLNLPNDQQESENMLKAVIPTLSSEDFLLETANKIYVEKNFEIKKEFQDIAVSVYQAQSQNIEFAESVLSAKEINDWVAEETHDKIQDLVIPVDLNAETKIVLVNALYFKANWSVPFKTTRTNKANFFKASDVSVNVDFMNVPSQLVNYYESDELDAKFVELPFRGGASITLVLPNKIEGIALLESQVGTSVAPPNYTKQFVQVALPKFKIETSIDFKEILKGLGIHQAFTSDADFSGIGGKSGDLFIDKIAQKTFIDVNENGIEAAATTTVTGGFLSEPLDAKKTFIADHPFFFYIKVDDIILFEGRILEPQY